MLSKPGRNSRPKLVKQPLTAFLDGLRNCYSRSALQPYVAVSQLRRRCKPRLGMARCVSMPDCSGMSTAPCPHCLGPLTPKPYGLDAVENHQVVASSGAAPGYFRAEGRAPCISAPHRSWRRREALICGSALRKMAQRRPAIRRRPKNESATLTARICKARRPSIPHLDGSASMLTNISGWSLSAPHATLCNRPRSHARPKPNREAP